MKKQTKGIRVMVYRPLVRCINCDLIEKVPINYGTLIKDNLCPNCRCKTLVTFSQDKLTKYVNE